MGIGEGVKAAFDKGEQGDLGGKAALFNLVVNVGEIGLAAFENCLDIPGILDLDPASQTRCDAF